MNENIEQIIDEIVHAEWHLNKARELYQIEFKRMMETGEKGLDHFSLFGEQLIDLQMPVSKFVSMLVIPTLKGNPVSGSIKTRSLV